jgi:hypothetical protein
MNSQHPEGSAEEKAIFELHHYLRSGDVFCAPQFRGILPKHVKTARWIQFVKYQAIQKSMNCSNMSGRSGPKMLRNCVFSGTCDVISQESADQMINTATAKQESLTVQLFC